MWAGALPGACERIYIGRRLIPLSIVRLNDMIGGCARKSVDAYRMSSSPTMSGESSSDRSKVSNVVRQLRSWTARVYELRRGEGSNPLHPHPRMYDLLGGSSDRSIS